MSYVRRLDVWVHAKTVGQRWPRGGDGGTIPAHLWVFTDCLVVTPTSPFSRSRPIRVLQNLDLEGLEPDAITAAYPKALRLDRDRVERVGYDGPRMRRFYAHFDLVGAPRFHLWVKSEMNELLFSVLRDTYPDVVTDDRMPRGPHDPQRGRRHPRSSSLVVPILIAAVAVIAAGLATWGGVETWYIGAARDFVPPGCEQDSCMVRRLDHIRCGSLFDQSVLANDPNCQNSLSMLRGRVIAGYAIAVIAGVGLIWWTLFQRRRRKRLYEPR